MKLVSNRKWSITENSVADQIKEWFVAHGGQKDGKITNPYEAWRIRYSDATFTYYKKGTLYVTDSNDGALLEAHGFVESVVGSRFVSPSRDFLIGFD